MLTFTGFAALAIAVQGAYQNPISTDRPDFTEGSRTVPSSAFQLELGATFEELEGSGTSATLGEALIRYGLQPGTELRLVLPSHSSTDDTGADVDGFGDFAVGFKHELNGDEKVEFALLGELTVPSGDDALRAAEATPMAAFIWGTESGGVSLGGQIQAEWPGGMTDLRHTFVVGFPAGDRLGLFAEHVVDFGETVTPAHMLHFGLTFQPDPDTQWDVHFGFGATDGAPDSFIGVGFSKRH